MAVETVQEYCDSVNEEGRNYLQDFIGFMASNFPELEPKISFSMPMWLLGVKMKEGYLAISAAKRHYSIHFSNEAFVIQLKEENPSWKGGKRCININYGDDETYSNIKQAVIQFMNSAREA